MKKTLTTLILIGLLVVPAVGLAQSEQQQMTQEFETVGDVMTLIEEIGNWIFTALMILAAIFLVMAGFFFITAGGNPENINKARQMLINALIGVAVGVGARGLVAAIEALVKA